jgi:WD40 repeat protein
MVQTRNRKSGKQSSETIITELPEPVSSSDRQQDVSFNFQGKQYSTYEEMVQAKRKRNNDYLKSSGLLDASAKVKEELSQTNGREASRRGLRADKKRKADLIRTTTRRKSNRLAGVQSDGIYVEEERGRGNFVIGGTIPNEIMSIDTSGVQVMKEEKQFFGNRVNDGSDLSVKEAVELSNPKWIKEDSLALANEFVSTLKSCHVDKKFGSPRSTVVETNADLLASQADNLSVDDENCVAKVVPDRIFSIAFHPSPHKLIAVAGDKKGHIGFWDVDNATNDNHGVHLFKPYNHPISNLEWFNNGTKLHSSAYDGSIRIFDVQKEVFTQSFATYDSSPEFKNKLGFGMEEGWMQFSCIDHRNENCIFYSTSYGDVVHLDLRQKGSVTCNANLSDKKINSIR